MITEIWKAEEQVAENPLLTGVLTLVPALLFHIRNGLVLGSLPDDVVHIDAIMTFVINAFAVTDKEYLGAFMMNLEDLRNLIRYASVTDEVKEVEQRAFRRLLPLEAVFCHGGDGATGAVLEDHHRLLPAFLSYFIQLGLIRKLYPVHKTKLGATTIHCCQRKYNAINVTGLSVGANESILARN